MTTAGHDTLQALIERLAAGEALDAEAIPTTLAMHPEVQRMLRLSRVMRQLDANAAAEPAAPASDAPARLGAFRLVRVLGSGGMGEVWLGERADGVVEQRVAVKRVRAGLAHFDERLREERRILARLEHPNIARFIDAGIDTQGAPWLALEFVDGVPLTDWCREHNLSLRERLQLFQKVCAAVEHAHRHLVVHRDLKPSNVLVNREGEPKLLDFGIAKLLDGSALEATVAALTPAYAAPEQLRGGEISTATDIYALGLLLFRLLAGALPDTRTGENAAAVLARLDEEETQRPSQRALATDKPLPYPPSALAGDLDAIVGQAIRGAPEDRYGSVTALADDIGRYLDARPVRARAPTRLYLFQRFLQRNRTAVALGALAAAALLVGSVVSLQQALRAEREAAAARRELVRAERISGFLGSLYREQDPLNRGSGKGRTPQLVLSDAVARIGRELGDDPQSAARLLRVLGEAQFNLSETGPARATLDLAASRAAAAGDRLLGAEIDALRGALALRELRQDDAERFFDGAWQVAVAARGEESPEAARIDARRAVSLVYLGRFKDALAAAQRAQRVLLQRLGPLDSEAIAAQVTLGVIQDQLRDDVAAIVTLRAAIVAIEAAFGPQDARLVSALQPLGEVLRRERDFDAARAVLLRGADIARAQFGARSVQLSGILTRRATLERDVGEPRRAIGVLDEAELALPDNEASARAQLLATRGGTWIELGDGVRAETDLAEALRLRRDTGGLRTGIAWFSQAQLGQALALQGRFTEAHALQAEAATELAKLLGPDAYQNSLIAQRRAWTYDRQGDPRKAVPFWREALRLVERTYGVDYHGHFETSYALANSLAGFDEGHTEAVTITDELLARWTGNPEIAQEYAPLVGLRCRLHLAAGERDLAIARAKSAIARPESARNAEAHARLLAIAAGA